MNFAEISKTLRKSRNLSQEALAKELQISKACISMIEIGKNEPTANTLIRYADFFQCSTDYLLGREDDFGNVTVSAPEFSPEEKQLLDVYRKLNKENRERLLVYAEIRQEEQNK